MKSKFLCGHDERHWFVAAIPEAARGVHQRGDGEGRAAAADGRFARGRTACRASGASTAATRRFLRQGEWFFVPVPDLRVEPWQIRRNEPLGARRVGRRTCCARPAGAAVHRLRARWPGRGRGDWTRMLEPASRGWHRPMIREPALYARGSVRHPDHATMLLRGWHRVVMNTEQAAMAMRHVTFVD